ncbi:MAG: DUF1326 domain-containing protein [Planctomycetota bacterium]
MSMRTLPLLAVLALPLLAGCTRRHAAAAPAAGTLSAQGDWELEGWRIIGCCCAAPCPCRINKKPMFCHGCDHSDVVHISKGRIGGVRVDDLDYVITGRVFAEDPKSNWTYVYVNDRASEEQYKAITDWLGAQVKGMGPKADHLVGKFVGARKVPMRSTVSRDRKEYGIEIPGILHFRTEAITNPGLASPVVSTGVLDAFGDRFVHAEAPVHKYEDAKLGYKYDLSGRQANQADFHIRSVDAVAQHGWGCWTANAALGGTGEYQERMLQHEGR